MGTRRSVAGDRPEPDRPAGSAGRDPPGDATGHEERDACGKEDRRRDEDERDARLLGRSPRRIRSTPSRRRAGVSRVGAGGTWATPVVPRSRRLRPDGPGAGVGEDRRQGSQTAGARKRPPAPSTAGAADAAAPDGAAAAAAGDAAGSPPALNSSGRPEVLLVGRSRPPTRSSPRLTDREDADHAGRRGRAS